MRTRNRGQRTPSIENLSHATRSGKRGRSRINIVVAKKTPTENLEPRLKISKDDGPRRAGKYSRGSHRAMTVRYNSRGKILTSPNDNSQILENDSSASAKRQLSESSSIDQPLKRVRNSPQKLESQRVITDAAVSMSEYKCEQLSTAEVSGDSTEGSRVQIPRTRRGHIVDNSEMGSCKLAEAHVPAQSDVSESHTATHPTQNISARLSEVCSKPRIPDGFLERNNGDDFDVRFGFLDKDLGRILRDNGHKIEVSPEVIVNDAPETNIIDDSRVKFENPSISSIFESMSKSFEIDLSIKSKDLYLALSGLLRPGLFKLWRTRKEAGAKLSQRSHLGRLRPNPRPRRYSDMVSGSIVAPLQVTDRSPLPDRIRGSVMRSGAVSAARLTAAKKLIRAKTHQLVPVAQIASPGRTSPSSPSSSRGSHFDITMAEPTTRRSKRVNAVHSPRNRRHPDVSHHIDWKFCYSASKKDDVHIDTIDHPSFRRKKIAVICHNTSIPSSDNHDSQDDVSDSLDAGTKVPVGISVPRLSERVESHSKQGDDSEHYLHIQSSVSRKLFNLTHLTDRERRKRRHALTVQRKRPANQPRNYVTSSTVNNRNAKVVPRTHGSFSDSSSSDSMLGGDAVYIRSLRHAKWYPSDTRNSISRMGSTSDRSCVSGPSTSRSRREVDPTRGRQYSSLGSTFNPKLFKSTRHRHGTTKRSEKMCQHTFLDKLRLGLECTVSQKDDGIHFEYLREKELNILTQRIHKTAFKIKSLAVLNSNDGALYNLVLNYSSVSDVSLRKSCADSLRYCREIYQPATLHATKAPNRIPITGRDVSPVVGNGPRRASSFPRPSKSARHQPRPEYFSDSELVIHGSSYEPFHSMEDFSSEHKGDRSHQKQRLNASQLARNNSSDSSLLSKKVVSSADRNSDLHGRFTATESLQRFPCKEPDQRTMMYQENPVSSAPLTTVYVRRQPSMGYSIHSARRSSPRKVIRKVYTGSSTIPKILNRRRPLIGVSSGSNNPSASTGTASTSSTNLSLGVGPSSSAGIVSSANLSFLANAAGTASNVVAPTANVGVPSFVYAESHGKVPPYYTAHGGTAFAASRYRRSDLTDAAFVVSSSSSMSSANVAAVSFTSPVPNSVQSDSAPGAKQGQPISTTGSSVDQTASDDANIPAASTTNLANSDPEAESIREEIDKDMFIPLDGTIQQETETQSEIVSSTVPSTPINTTHGLECAEPSSTDIPSCELGTSMKPATALSASQLLRLKRTSDAVESSVGKARPATISSDQLGQPFQTLSSQQTQPVKSDQDCSTKEPATSRAACSGKSESSKQPPNSNTGTTTAFGDSALHNRPSTLTAAAHPQTSGGNITEDEDFELQPYSSNHHSTIPRDNLSSLSPRPHSAIAFRLPRTPSWSAGQAGLASLNKRSPDPNSLNPLAVRVITSSPNVKPEGATLPVLSATPLLPLQPGSTTCQLKAVPIAYPLSSSSSFPASTVGHQGSNLTSSEAPLSSASRRTVLHKIHSFRKILPKAIDQPASVSVAGTAAHSTVSSLPTFNVNSTAMTRVPVIGRFVRGDLAHNPGTIDLSDEAATVLLHSQSGLPDFSASFKAVAGSGTGPYFTQAALSSNATHVLKSLLERSGERRDVASQGFTFVPSAQPVTPIVSTQLGLGLATTVPSVLNTGATTMTPMPSTSHWVQPAHQSKGTWQMSGRQVVQRGSSPQPYVPPSSSMPGVTVESQSFATTATPVAAERPSSQTDDFELPPCPLNLPPLGIRLTPGSGSRLQQLQQHYQRQQQQQLRHQKVEPQQ